MSHDTFRRREDKRTAPGRPSAFDDSTISTSRDSIADSDFDHRLHHSDDGGNRRRESSDVQHCRIKETYRVKTSSLSFLINFTKINSFPSLIPPANSLISAEIHHLRKVSNQQGARRFSPSTVVILAKCRRRTKHLRASWRISNFGAARRRLG